MNTNDISSNLGLPSALQDNSLAGSLDSKNVLGLRAASENSRGMADESFWRSAQGNVVVGNERSLIKEHSDSLVENRRMWVRQDLISPIYSYDYTSLLGNSTGVQISDPQSTDGLVNGGRSKVFKTDQPDVGNARKSAYKVRKLDSAKMWNSVGGGDRADFYEFRLKKDSSFRLQLQASDDNVEVSLIDGSTGKVIAEPMYRSGGERGSIGQALPKGTYFLKVTGGRENSDYRLSLSEEPGSGFGNAQPIDLLGRKRVVQRETLEAGDTADCYKFSLDEPTDLTLNLEGLEHNADLAVYDNAGNQVAISRNFGNESEAIALQDLSPRDYYVKVLGRGKDTKYSLSMSGERVTPGGGTTDNGTISGGTTGSGTTGNGTTGGGTTGGGTTGGGTINPIAEGSVIKDSSNRYYWIQDGKRREIPDPETVQKLGFQTEVKSVSDTDRDKFPSGTPLPSRRDGVLLRDVQEGNVYLMQDGKRDLVLDPNGRGESWKSKIQEVLKADLDQIEKSNISVETLSKLADEKEYRKYTIQRDDNPSTIARKELGDEALRTGLRQADGSRITNQEATVLQIGSTLFIPQQVRKYSFTYSYDPDNRGNSDYYTGYFNAYAGKYSQANNNNPNDPNLNPKRVPNETGKDGRYFIDAETIEGSKDDIGKVFVDRYYDFETKGFKDFYEPVLVSQEKPGLGNEYGFIERNESPDNDFGLDQLKYDGFAISSVVDEKDSDKAVYPGGKIKIDGRSITPAVEFYLNNTVLSVVYYPRSDSGFTAVLDIPEYLRDSNLGAGRYQITTQLGNQKIIQDQYIDIELNYERFNTTLDYMHKEMINNFQSAAARSIREYIQKGKKSAAIVQWTYQVAPGQPWDHKPKLAEKLGFQEKKEWFNFPIKGDSEHEYYYDIWSNIHYGYVGASVGFSREELQKGATVPGIAGTNDDGDVLSVNIGFDLWEKYAWSLSTEDLRQAILDKTQDFLKIGQDNPKEAKGRKVFSIDNGR
jgi:hypothetical protein